MTTSRSNPTPQDMERARVILARVKDDGSTPVHIIAQAIADERERCAKVCDNYALDLDFDKDDPSFNEGCEQGADRCAAAIRSVGDHA